VFLKFILAIAMGIISFPVLGKTAFNNSQLTPVKMWVMTSAFTLLHLSKCKTLGIFDSVANSFVEAT
jgi:hypothetical protein